MELFFQRLGEGPPLIVLHGLYGSSDNWMGVARSLARHFELWVVDQRNHGRSPHHPVHTYTALRDDLLEFMDNHRLTRASILGHSMGGKTAMFFAAGHPERVSALIVVDIAPRSYLLHDDPSLGTTDHGNILRGLSQVNIRDTTSRLVIEERLASFIHSPRVVAFLMKNLHRDPQNHFHWRINVDAITDNLEHILDGMQVRDFEKGRGVTGFPVLFIRGGDSAYIRNEDIGLIKTIFPMAEVVTIPGSGHWVHAEQPDPLIRNVDYFLRS